MQPVRGLLLWERVLVDALEEQASVEHDEGFEAAVQLRRVPGKILQEQLPHQALSVSSERRKIKMI